MRPIKEQMAVRYATTEMEELQAECDSLRAALEQISKIAENDGDDTGTVFIMGEIARNALLGLVKNVV